MLDVDEAKSPAEAAPVFRTEEGDVNPVFVEAVVTATAREDAAGLRALHEIGVPFEIMPANSNPVRMNERQWEAMDLIVKAWTNHDGPFSHEGRFFHHRNVNIWPRPWQQPHPPVWIPGGGSVETWDFCAENDFVYGALTMGSLAIALYTQEVAGYSATVAGLATLPSPILSFLFLIGAALIADGLEATQDRFNRSGPNA